jgi:hypothetical protein
MFRMQMAPPLRVVYEAGGAAGDDALVDRLAARCLRLEVLIMRLRNVHVQQTRGRKTHPTAFAHAPASTVTANVAELPPSSAPTEDVLEHHPMHSFFAAVGRAALQCN